MTSHIESFCISGRAEGPGRVVGLICDNTLFLKITNNSTDILIKEKVKLKTGQAYPSSKDFYIVTEEVLENRKLLQKLFEGIYEDVPDKKLSKKKKVAR
jgi:hypothetical protein